VGKVCAPRPEKHTTSSCIDFSILQNGLVLVKYQKTDKESDVFDAVLVQTHSTSITWTLVSIAKTRNVQVMSFAGQKACSSVA
jgi:hypothetical protein